ncbi:MAG: DUF4238 domain-containing protein [Novosphingobium sp.]|uniref:DUF4238 domain-containing protein n=1 Tax=Novosphingobium sp. TaxID=1874826 RepID=UPI00262BF6E8|nr:DUF4238 domain-containing protein [Novosphingobium sp.]MCP5386895.1 DUF4238 domain-containing protein [Novosphingobium sp.]
MKHHYVPQFLLSGWTDGTGRLFCFSRRNGRLVCSRRTPKSTGYESGLYALLADVSGFSRDIVEEKIFARIDDGAAKAVEKLERHERLSEADHIAWTFFLSSLRVRQPDTIEFLRTQGMALLRKSLADRDAITLPEGWPTTQEWFTENHPGMLEASPLTSWLPRMIFNTEVLDAFGDLKWWFREFEPEDGRLLLSDLPLYWDGGFSRPGFHIHVPISPHRLFIGTRTKETEAVLSQIPSAELIERVNRASIASASQRLWASSREDAHAFIESNLDIMGVDAVTMAVLASRQADEHD